MLIVNAFSLNMFNPSICFPVFREIDVNEVKTYPLESAIGHADTAHVLSNILERNIPTNRATVSLNGGDTAIVAQYIGPRLPEGATQLPEGATIKFYHVKMVDKFTFVWDFGENLFSEITQELFGHDTEAHHGEAQYIGPRLPEGGNKNL